MKMMIHSLCLRGYRAFERFEMNDLARVNLFVGKNGCGKTSVLEAVRLLMTKGYSRELRDIAFRRGETTAMEDPVRERELLLPNIRHFFHGRNLVPNTFFEIARNGTVEKIRAELRDATDKDAQQRLFADFSDDIPRYALEIAKDIFPVSEDGALYLGRPYGMPRHSEPEKMTPIIQFVSADSLNIDSMSNIWNRVIINSLETEVVDAMRILDPSIEDIFFLNEYPSRGGRGAILVSFGDSRGRVPLGSIGEGMRRLLALSLSLIQAKHGILLVDEIDTGLHYSVLGSMWRLIVEAAKKSDIQVFATTHSLDCVKGLAWLCENHPELREEVALHKIDESLHRSVAFDAEQIVIADEQGIEVR